MPKRINASLSRPASYRQADDDTTPDQSLRCPVGKGSTDFSTSMLKEVNLGGSWLIRCDMREVGAFQAKNPLGHLLDLVGCFMENGTRRPISAT
jgi:hypothetical protein